MRTGYRAAIATAALAAATIWAAYTDPAYCPPPSPASVASLFAPCQAFASAMGHTVTKQEAVRMGLLRPTNQPALTPAEPPTPSPAQLVAQDFQIMEHATVGAANSPRQH